MLCLMHLIHHVVHMYIKKKKTFWTGALGPQVISVNFQKTKIGLGALSLLSNLFLRTLFFGSFKDSIFFFFKSLIFKRTQDDPFDKTSSKS